MRQIEGEGQAEVHRRIKGEKDKREGDIIQIQRYEREREKEWEREREIIERKSEGDIGE